MDVSYTQLMTLRPRASRMCKILLSRLMSMLNLAVTLGNVACAIHAAAELGSQAFGMFIKCQHKLQSEPLSNEEVSAFRKALVVWNLCYTPESAGS